MSTAEWQNIAGFKKIFKKLCIKLFCNYPSKLKYHSSTIFLVLGDIMQLINQLGIANNTLIIFTSDNGAALVSRQKGMPIKYHVFYNR